MIGKTQQNLAWTLTLLATACLATPAAAGPPTMPGNPGVPGLLAEIEALEAEVAELELAVTGLESQLTAADLELEAQAELITALDAELIAADQQLEVAQAELAVAIETIEALDLENLDLEGEVAELQVALADLTQVVVLLQSRLTLPATGQTGCFDGAGNPIACAGTGQDGEYQNGMKWTNPRFEDNGDGTVTDHFTGLVWLKHADCIAFVDWEQALTIASTMGEGACGLWDGSTSGDWRLPNVRELHSLVDFSQSYPALPAGHPFVGVSSWAYCSSTSFQLPEQPEDWMTAGPDEAYKVNFAAGAVSVIPKSQVCKVWLVRDAQ